MRLLLCLLLLTACGNPVEPPELCPAIVGVSLSAQGDTLGYVTQSVPCSSLHPSPSP